jgi:putative ABC transport system permease protein
VQLAVSGPDRSALFKAIKDLPNAQGLSVRADAKENIEQTLIKTSVFSIGLMVIFAGIIAFGSTLNAALVEIGDRVREISTLRVLGYSPREVWGILLRQSMITFVLGVVLAFPLGLAMVHGLSTAYNTELYRMPVVIRPVVVGYTVGLAVLFVMLAQAIGYWQVRKLDWLEGVQVKE